MKVLFLAQHKWPSVGGVERHINSISKSLSLWGYETTTISGEDIKYPKIKIIGLLYIWFWLFKNRKLIIDSDIIHIHDVFIWYLPFRFLYPAKKVFITFHGWEGRYPIPWWNIFNKRIANYLCNGSIAVGKYIEKYYDIKPTFVVYGGVEAHGIKDFKKAKNSIVWLGRKDKDTGYFEFRKWLKTRPHLKVKYITNVKNPEKYLKTAEYCAPAGYLSYLEAKSYDCKIITFANNTLKEDYWEEIRDIYDDKLLKSIPTWEEVTRIYRKLWRI